jgi:hypothetical protein
LKSGGNIVSFESSFNRIWWAAGSPPSYLIAKIDFKIVRVCHRTSSTIIHSVLSSTAFHSYLLYPEESTITLALDGRSTHSIIMPKLSVTPK